MKGLTHVQYQSPISSGLKVMAKVKVFQKKVKHQGQGHKVNKTCVCETGMPPAATKSKYGKNL